MIKVYTANHNFINWPEFTTFNAAWDYIKNNSYEFNNGDIIALVDYKNHQSKFIEARFKLEFTEIGD